jgi:hypothetical protein
VIRFIVIEQFQDFIHRSQPRFPGIGRAGFVCPQFFPALPPNPFSSLENEKFAHRIVDH